MSGKKCICEDVKQQIFFCGDINFAQTTILRLIYMYTFKIYMKLESMPLYFFIGSHYYSSDKSTGVFIAQSLGKWLTGSICYSPAWCVCCYHCPAVQSYATLLQGLQVLLLPTVPTITPFQLLSQLLHHLLLSIFHTCPAQ